VSQEGSVVVVVAVFVVVDVVDVDVMVDVVVVGGGYCRCWRCCCVFFGKSKSYTVLYFEL
jgi:hypothetical protein